MRLATLALAAALPLAVAMPALAEDPGVNSPVDANIVMTAKAAAVGVGYTWGSGTLIFDGHDYPFSVKGLDIADVGFATVTSHGRVYHLRRLADFSGTYAVATGNATAGSGVGGQLLRNGNGVMIRIDEVSKGARLAGAAGGIRLTLE